MAYLPQNPVFPKDATILSYAYDGIPDTDWTAKSEVKSVLSKLGITEYEAKIETLSGGQKKRVALAKTIATSFDVLLLDEPTNHLDQDMIAWLEEYLKKYNGVVIMVTHDRYFLDKVTNRILEISRGSLYSYEANYTKFLENESTAGRNGTGIGTQETKCASHGIGMGKTWMPRQNDEAKS